MSRRGKFWVKVSILLYALMLGLYAYAVIENRDQVHLPRFIKGKIELPHADELATGAAALASRLQELAAPRYRSREAIEGLLAYGQLLDRGTLQALVARKRGFVLIYDPVHLRHLATVGLKAGKDYRVGGELLTKLGDRLDEAALCRLALHWDRVTDPAGRVFVQGHNQLWGLDLTLVYIWLNFLALMGILYGLFWEPLRRVITERSQRIAQQIQETEKAREEAELLHRAVEERLARLGGAAVARPEPYGRRPAPGFAPSETATSSDRLAGALRAYLEHAETDALSNLEIQARNDAWTLLQMLGQRESTAESEARASGVRGAVDLVELAGEALTRTPGNREPEGSRTQDRPESGASGREPGERPPGPPPHPQAPSSRSAHLGP